MKSVAHFPLYGLSLLGALLLYALFGSPTPDNPSLVEVFLAILLILAVGWRGLVRALNVYGFKTPFLKYLQLFFLCGLVVPTLSAVFHDNAFGLILRDMAAFMFLALPLFLSSRISHDPLIQKYLMTVFVLIGLAFSLRTLLPVLNIWIDDNELLYLSNSPIVMVTAIYLILTLWGSFYNISIRSLIKIGFIFIALCIVLSSMLLDVQRATIGAVFISLAVVAFIDFLKKPKKVYVPIIIVLAVGVALWPSVSQIFDVMAIKTAQVGMNSRIAEANAVFDVVTGDMATFLFGHGWGAVFSSPAVAGLDVNYTHSLLTTVFLKGGFLFLISAFCMVAAALYEIFYIFRQDKTKGLMAFWGFVIPVLLYASHKSLDFGVVLLMISLWTLPMQSLQNHPPSAKKNKNNESVIV